MACGDGALLSQLKDLVTQIEGGCCGPCPTPCSNPCPAVFCPPTTRPIATCCMVCPPPILAPTVPQPVKPLQLPCCCSGTQGEMSQEQAEKTRYANFYNNYNIDYHPDSSSACPPPAVENRKNKCKGVTTFGKSPCCEDYMKKKKPCGDKGCPTGFKPCTMKMTPPPGCHPCGVWCAEIQACPPKPRKKVSCFYVPGPCTRPCCKHWKPKDGRCIYPKPCKAHCYNHPPGMKAITF
ncbi:hypothetical protein NQ317_016060 [Molorchus minor]|uniref:Uncharacterized protein n=1 Tax=Molorchus minor TaxID=1323400 RepID=A0ABQ9JE15_9CUCU|nr:hypothetical protein NQ317_016060 [Molorchus minor]